MKALLIDVLLTFATVVAVLSVLGLIAMKDAYQRLHYLTPIVAISLPLIVVAVWIETNDFQARIKALMIFLILFGMNAVVSHATARAHRIRTKGHWEIEKT